MTLSVLVWALVIILAGQNVAGNSTLFADIPRGVIVMYGISSAFFVWLSRGIASWLLRDAPLPLGRIHPKTDPKKVVIYGAGTTGIQLLQALRQGSAYKPVGFIEDDKTLWRQRVAGLKVYSPERIEQFIIQGPRLTKFFSPSRKRPGNTSAPSFARLSGIRWRLRRFRLLKILHRAVWKSALLDLLMWLDLLGRDPVPSDPKLLQGNITGKVVMVTGAGGSIGSEISRQVLRQRPQKLILFEMSEVALYEIEMELADLQRAIRSADDSHANSYMRTQPEIVLVLGSVLDKDLVRTTLTQHKVDHYLSCGGL